MRYQTLKTYTKDKLEEYYKKPLFFKQLLKDAENDQRLAEAAQAFFLANNQQAKADAFSKYTSEKYSVEEFKDSPQKYARQFRSKQSNRMEAKLELKEYVLEEMAKKNVTFYKLAKHLNTSQSNVDCFFKKNDMNKLSFEQLMKLRDFLART